MGSLHTIEGSVLEGIIGRLVADNDGLAPQLSDYVNARLGLDPESLETALDGYRTRKAITDTSSLTRQEAEDVRTDIEKYTKEKGDAERAVTDIETQFKTNYGQDEA